MLEGKEKKIEEWKVQHFSLLLVGKPWKIYRGEVRKMIMILLLWFLNAMRGRREK